MYNVVIIVVVIIVVVVVVVVAVVVVAVVAAVAVVAVVVVVVRQAICHRSPRWIFFAKETEKQSKRYRNQRQLVVSAETDG